MATKKPPASKPATKFNKKEVMDTLRSKVEQGLVVHADKLDADYILKDIMNDVKRAKFEIVAKLLGFDNHWGKWEVDHCNGRISHISDWIAEQIKDQLREFMAEVAKEVITAKFRADLKKQLIAAVKKDMADTSYKVREAAAELSLDVLQAAKQELRDELLKEFRGNSDDPV